MSNTFYLPVKGKMIKLLNKSNSYDFPYHEYLMREYKNNDGSVSLMLIPKYWHIIDEYSFKKKKILHNCPNCCHYCTVYVPRFVYDEYCFLRKKQYNSVKIAVTICSNCINLVSHQRVVINFTDVYDLIQGMTTDTLLKKVRPLKKSRSLKKN